MGSKPRALVIGVWGDPSRWSQVNYKISIPSLSHEGIKRLAQRIYGNSSWGIVTHSTTLALTCFFKGFADVKTIIFGLDSLADLNDSTCLTTGVRECAARRYEDFLNKFINSIDKGMCGIDSYKQFIEIVVTPARGSFHGYRFSGSPTHVFNKAFAKIMSAMEEFSPSFVILDVTHGINYQTISIQYATLAALQLTNKLNTIRGKSGGTTHLVIMNSEPIPPPKVSHQDVKKVRHVEEVQQMLYELNILDVSEIANALDFINTLTNALSFRLTQTTISIEEELGREVKEALQRLLMFVKLVENSAIGITYPGSIDTNGKPLGQDICSIELDTEPPDTEYMPQIIVPNEVKYVEVSTAPILVYVLNKAISSLQQSLCTERAKMYLEDYLNIMATLLKRAGLNYAHYIVSIEGSKWGTVSKALTRLLSECWKEFESVAKEAKEENKMKALHEIIYDDGGVRVVKHMLMALRNTESCIISSGSCAELARAIVKNYEQKGVVHGVDVEIARNMIAHAGLSYDFIEMVIFVKDGNTYRASRAVFSKDLVLEFLNNILRFKEET
jgi:CRISPR-associated protein Csx1